MTQFELVFKGEIVEDFAVDQVKENVAKLFKANHAQVVKMFSGNVVVLRNRLDDATAKKYQAILLKHGAVCNIRAMGGTNSTSNSVNPQESIPATIKRVATVGGLPVAGERVDEILANIEWDIAPTGSRLAEDQDSIPLPEHDLSHLSVAPAGSDMGQKEKEAPPPPPDTSHISLKN